MVKETRRSTKEDEKGAKRRRYECGNLHRFSTTEIIGFIPNEKKSEKREYNGRKSTTAAYALLVKVAANPDKDVPWREWAAMCKALGTPTAAVDVPVNGGWIEKNKFGHKDGILRAGPTLRRLLAGQPIERIDDEDEDD